MNSVGGTELSKPWVGSMMTEGQNRILGKQGESEVQTPLHQLMKNKNTQTEPKQMCICEQGSGQDK